jgi:hypothetical protein
MVLSEAKSKTIPLYALLGVKPKRKSAKEALDEAKKRKRA